MTNKITETSRRRSAATSRERAPRHDENTPRERQGARPECRSGPSGSEDTHAATVSGPNRAAIRPAAPAEQVGGGPRSRRTTQVVDGEHRKESAKGH